MGTSLLSRKILVRVVRDDTVNSTLCTELQTFFDAQQGPLVVKVAQGHADPSGGCAHAVRVHQA
jgi:hypothetical protein